MAIAKFGAIITVGAGRLGGHLFRRGKYGVTVVNARYATAKHLQLHPSSMANFAVARSRWQALSASDKLLWSNLGTRLPKIGWEGDNLQLLGSEFHERNTVRLLQNGVTTVIDPVNFSNSIPLTSFIQAVWDLTLEVANVAYEPFPSFYTTVIDTTTAVEQVIDPSKLIYANLTTYTGNNTSSASLAASLLARYPSATVNSVIYVRVKVITSDGQTGPYFFGQITIVV